MTDAALEAYLHAHIPLSRAMGVSVVEVADDYVTLGAPLAPNINHRETAFGGSVSALAILAAWSLLHLRLTASGRASRLVIQRNSVDYMAPISADFTATATLASDNDWPGFVRMLDRRGRARIAAEAVVRTGGEPRARLRGDFVALGTQEQ